MILATAGHIDHGKTALVEALTGVDADRLPEEKRRGMTIDLGFAYAALADGTELGFVDVPGHERFVPNMLAGVLSIDRVLLVVAADDGPRPQTIEHLDILELIGVAEVTGVVTKIDRVEPARAAAVAAETGELLAAAGYAESPVFAVSSRTGDGLAALCAHLRQSADAAANARGSAPPQGRFRMPVDRAFSLPGIGQVVTGTVAAGAVHVGDRLAISPRRAAVRVRGLHARNRPIGRAAAGERCAINIVGASGDGAATGRGDWVVARELDAPAARIDLLLRVSRFAGAALRDGLPVHVHVGTADVVARLAVLGARSIAPGETGFVQLDLERPVAALNGDRVLVRDHAARHTLGGGRVVDPFAPRRGRRLPARLALLGAMARVDPAAALAGSLEVLGAVDLAQFALVRNLAPLELAALADNARFLRVGSEAAPVAVTAERLAELGAELLSALAAWHEAQPDTLGPARPALFEKLRAETPEAALDAALARLAANQKAVREGGMWRLPGHRPRLGRADEKLWERVRPLLDTASLRPPRVRELAAALALEPEPVDRFLRRAERLGRVCRVADNRYFLPHTLKELAAIAGELADASPDGSFTAAMFKDRSGVGRNLTIRVLEYLDRMGATRRVGDSRVMAGGVELFC